MKKFKPDLFLIAGAEGMGHHALRDVLSDFLNRDDVMWFRYGSSPYFNIIPGVKTSRNSTKVNWNGTYEDSWLIDENKFRSLILDTESNGIKYILNDNSFPFLPNRNPLRRPDYLKIISIAQSLGIKPKIITIYRNPVYSAWSGYRRKFSKNLIYQAQVVENSLIIISSLIRMSNSLGINNHLIIYEDLIENPEEEINKMCNFLELPVDIAKNININSNKIIKPEGPKMIPDDSLRMLQEFFSKERVSQWGDF